jgi:hypothetical protein
MAFGGVLRTLVSASTPENRVARHLLHLDTGETYTFAYEHPEALKPGRVRKPKQATA